MHHIQASQLSRFIECTENFKIDQFTRAEVAILEEDIFVNFDCPEGSQANLFILYQAPYEMQIQSMVHILRQLAPRTLCTTGIEQDEIVGVHIAFALENTTEEVVSEVLPALRSIQLEKYEFSNKDYWNEPVASMEQFLFLCQFSGCPVTVLIMEDEFVEADWRQ
ncbi:hypothetical protein V8E53_011130 [Lactarius tabidus]